MSGTETSYSRRQTANGHAAHSATNGYLKADFEPLHQTAAHTLPPKLNRGSWFIKLSACTAAGVVFGFAAEKAKGVNSISVLHEARGLDLANN